MARAWHPLLRLLAGGKSSDLHGQIQFLKAENEVLRSKLPKRIKLTPQERRRLVKLGKPLGKQLRHLLTIVSPRTFLRWMNEEERATPGNTERQRGRPKTDAEIRQLVILLAKENAWGYTRILGELKKLGIQISRSTVVNILKSEGFDTAPRRSETTWSQFLQQHADTLWACDFFHKKIWTTKGLVDCFVLFFLHVATRKVYLAGVSTNPNNQWVVEQAKGFTAHLAATHQQATLLIRDLDAKFTADFDATLKAAGVKIKPVGPRAPNLNPHAERFVLSIKQECLDHFIVFGQDHLLHLASTYIDSYYNVVRPHQGKDNRPLAALGPPEEADPPSPATIACDEMLGGLLKHYHRKAA
ncbi:MAG: transposase [Planctomycetes bacterium]|nr:transposase [Planctomycetota bacterium]